LRLKSAANFNVSLQILGAEFRLEGSFLHSMHVDDVPSDIEVIFFTLLIADYKEQVKSAHDGRTDVDIVIKRASPVVSAMYRVSSSQDRSTGI